MPKQYLRCENGQTVLEQTLQVFLHHPRIEQVLLPLHPEDDACPHVIKTHPKVTTLTGGASRALSVFAGLQYLQPHAKPEDWILVHDACRPCLLMEDLNQLITSLTDHPTGGLLVSPSENTLKFSIFI